MGGRTGGHLLRNDFSIAWRAARKEAGVRGAVAAAVVAAAAVLMSATTPIHAQTAATGVSLEVHAGEPGPTINRDIFSQFAEHLGEGI